MAEEEHRGAELKRGGLRGGLVFGLILIGLGVILLVDNLFPGLGFGKLWPLVVIVWGLGVFVSGLIPPVSGARFLRGIFIGTVGVILLYNALGIIPFSFWVDLIALWPVLLIALGFAILGGVTGSRTISALSSIIIIATLILAFVYNGIIFQERRLAGAQFSRDMIRDVRSGTASVDFGVGNLEVGSTEKLYDIDAREPFGRKKPRLTSERSGSSVDLSLRTPREVRWFLGSRRRRWDVLLSEDVDWRLDVKTGVSDTDLDLKRLKMRKLDLQGGVGNITVRFGNRVKQASATVDAGISQLRILVPKSMGVRLRVKKGLSTSDFEDIELRRLGGEDRIIYETPSFDSAGKKLFLNIDVGISSFVVEGY